MARRTKIVATLGPATDDKESIGALVKAGVDVVRLNLSHGVHDDHRRRATLVRECAKESGRHVAVLVDLQGPKIRVDRFENGKVFLTEGAPFILDAACDPDKGTVERVGLAYKQLPNDVDSGDVLLLDDGRVVLEVEKVVGTEIHCSVVVGGDLSNSKGINRQGGGLTAEAITEKDRFDITLAAEIEADYLAVSFPRSAADVLRARGLLHAAGNKGAGIVAKIERSEAMENLEEIIVASDVVMIARGDLGVEIGDAELPAAQKHIIKMARSLKRVVITATQMMESMIENPIPTRAEVFDVANAVLDGTDAVMLSAETAAGKYPSKAVSAMGRICIEAEKQLLLLADSHSHDHSHNLGNLAGDQFGRIDEAIAMATMYTANHMGVRAIIALTESGSTPLWMSRISSGIPIYAMTPHLSTCRKVVLYRGVSPVQFGADTTDHALLNKLAIEELQQRTGLEDGDLVIITKGDLVGAHGGTNAMKIVRIGDMVEPDA
ncbi:MAG: pyruvate kinase [Gammaproteobacteria bacterium]|nr:pyruvate kinase [Gammaproteobacteria bacterium]